MLSNKELSVEDILNYEKTKYKTKGYGLIMATFTFSIWFFLVPQIAYYIYPKKIANPNIFTALAILFTHHFTWYLANFVCWIIYKIELPFFERYKTDNKPWPWKADPEKWNFLIKKSIRVIFINQFLITPGLIYIIYSIINEPIFRTSYETLPTCFEVIWQTTFNMIVEDFAFYWTHRFLHWDKIYKYIHKQHHEYVSTVSLASEYASPIEHVLSNILPSLGPLILRQRMHLFTKIMWIVLRLFETTDEHSGYEFSWSPFRLLPMSGSSEYHSFHHLNFKGNYGSFFTFWDTVCNTINKGYQEFADKKKDLIIQSLKIQDLKQKN